MNAGDIPPIDEEIKAHVLEVQQKITAACKRVNRDPADVTLVAVSKTKSVEAILAAAAAGVQHFGENRVEEAGAKIPQVKLLAEHPLQWHMIGHIQSRKAAEAASIFDLIHSVDSLKLAGKFSRISVESHLEKPLKVLIQVNVSGEATKGGLEAVNWSQDETVRKVLWDEFEQILALPGLEVRGLMMMAPYWNDLEALRPFFKTLASLRKTLLELFGIVLPELSMGMTNDYEIAIEEGATIVRVGRAIFGER